MLWNPRRPLSFKEIFRGGAASKVESRGRIKSVTQKSLLLSFSLRFFLFFPRLHFRSLLLVLHRSCHPRVVMYRVTVKRLSILIFVRSWGLVPLFAKVEKGFWNTSNDARGCLWSRGRWWDRPGGWRNKSRRRNYVCMYILRVFFISDFRENLVFFLVFFFFFFFFFLYF